MSSLKVILIFDVVDEMEAHHMSSQLASNS